MSEELMVDPDHHTSLMIDTHGVPVRRTAMGYPPHMMTAFA